MRTERSWASAYRPGTAQARRWLSAALVGLCLTGCATGAARPDPPTGAYAAAPPPSETGPARTTLAVIGTPFFIVFKAAVCALTTVVAAPGIGITALADPTDQGWQRRDLEDGFAANCGPPWILR